MSITKRSIFRERAIQHYVLGRDKNVLPRIVSPPVFLSLWIILGLCMTLGWLAWTIHIPVYVPGTGLIVANAASGETQAVLFVSADQRSSIHVGETVQVQIGSSGPLLQRAITSVAPTLLSPLQAIRQYNLDGAALLLVTQPAVVVVVTLNTQISAFPYAGSIVQAQIQVREQNLLSSLPVIGPLIGG